MTNEQTTTELALRILGNSSRFDWCTVKDSIWGIKMLAINLGTNSVDLNEIHFTAMGLQIEELKNA